MKTAAANEARMMKVDERYAERLRSRGWVLFSPAVIVALTSSGEKPPTLLPGEIPHPCIPVCSDPVAHAEGGHDV